MSPKKVIHTDKAPPPLPGIYNQAIVANGTVYCSGSIGMDPNTKQLVEGDIGARTVRNSSFDPDIIAAEPPPDTDLQELGRCPRSRWYIPRERDQGQHLHSRHEGFFCHERSLQGAHA